MKHKWKTRTAVTVALLVAVALLAAGGCYRVGQGEEALVLTFGEVTDVKGPGLYWRVPLAQQVIAESVTTIHTQEYGFRTTSGGTTNTAAKYVDVLEEEIVEGMEDAEHDHDHDAEEHDHEEEHQLEPGQLAEVEYDEHIWTSPVNAMEIVQVICQTLSSQDPENREIYEANAAAYEERLLALDQAFRNAVAAGTRDMIVVADRFPFRYLAETYGISYRAAFSGCSGDTEPSARTIAYLIDQVREKDLPAVYYLELSSHRVAEIISEETGARTLLLHSCHNVTRQEFDEGVTYLQLMEQNVENLKTGLGAAE